MLVEIIHVVMLLGGHLFTLLYRNLIYDIPQLIYSTLHKYLDYFKFYAVMNNTILDLFKGVLWTHFCSRMHRSSFQRYCQFSKMVLSIHTPVRMRLYILHSHRCLIFQYQNLFTLWAFNGVPLCFHLHFLMINKVPFVCLLEICFLLKYLLLFFPFSMNCLFSFFFICSYFIYSLVSCKYFPLHGFFILNGVFEDQKFLILCYPSYHCFSWQGLFGSYLRNLSIFLGFEDILLSNL